MIGFFGTDPYVLLKFSEHTLSTFQKLKLNYSVLYKPKKCFTVHFWHNLHLQRLMTTLSRFHRNGTKGREMEVQQILPVESSCVKSANIGSPIQDMNHLSKMNHLPPYHVTECELMHCITMCVNAAKTRLFYLI